MATGQIYHIAIDEEQRKLITEALKYYRENHAWCLYDLPSTQQIPIGPNNNQLEEVVSLHDMFVDLTKQNQKCEPFQSVRTQMLNGFCF